MTLRKDCADARIRCVHLYCKLQVRIGMMQDGSCREPLFKLLEGLFAGECPIQTVAPSPVAVK